MMHTPLLLYWLLALVSVSLSALGQTLMKVGMTQPAVHRALGLGAGPAILTVLQTVPVIGGLAVYGLGAVLWLLVLSKLPVSAVYPLVSLAIVFVVVIGTAFLHETVSFARIAGVAVVIAGLLLISRSA